MLDHREVRNPICYSLLDILVRANLDGKPTEDRRECA